MKSDNGSHFTAASVQDLLARYGVTWLPSPPYCPTYNGSIEAGIGGIKARAESLAAAAGRPTWTRADLDQARWLANEHSHPRRLDGATPAEVWEARAPLDVGLRVEFLAACRDLRQAAARAIGELDLSSLSTADWREAQRNITAQALVGFGFLSYRRRRIAPRVRRLKIANIT